MGIVGKYQAGDQGLARRGYRRFRPAASLVAGDQDVPRLPGDDPADARFLDPIYLHALKGDVRGPQRGHGARRKGQHTGQAHQHRDAEPY
ncbi:hypothetical protein D3C85_1610150 [compost metagenome]